MSGLESSGSCWNGKGGRSGRAGDESIGAIGGDAISDIITRAAEIGFIDGGVLLGIGSRGFQLGCPYVVRTTLVSCLIGVDDGHVGNVGAASQIHVKG